MLSGKCILSYYRTSAIWITYIQIQFYPAAALSCRNAPSKIFWNTYRQVSDMFPDQIEDWF